MENEGITKDDLTPEYIADNLDRLMDLSDAHEVSVETLLDEVEQ
jgi:hypothetical protein